MKSIVKTEMPASMLVFCILVLLGGLLFFVGALLGFPSSVFQGFKHDAPATLTYLAVIAVCWLCLRAYGRELLGFLRASKSDQVAR